MNSISPDLSHQVRAEVNFLTRGEPKPAVYQYAPPDGVQPIDARRETVDTGRYSLAVWQAGPATAPAVLLAHGWGGRGVQMQSFVAPLLASGYRVVWFDQPGHGDSGRGPVALPVEPTSAITSPFSTNAPFLTRFERL